MQVQPETVKLKRGVLVQVVGDVVHHHSESSLDVIQQTLRDEILEHALPEPSDTWLHIVASDIASGHVPMLQGEWLTQAEGLYDIYGDPHCGAAGREPEQHRSPPSSKTEPASGPGLEGPASSPADQWAEPPSQDRWPVVVGALLALLGLFALWRSRQRIASDSPASLEPSRQTKSIM